MGPGIRRAWRDAFIRLCGAALAMAALFALQELVRLVPTEPPQHASVAELCLATIGFLGASVGAALMALGAHVHDRVRVSARWARRHTQSSDHVRSGKDQSDRQLQRLKLEPVQRRL